MRSVAASVNGRGDELSRGGDVRAMRVTTTDTVGSGAIDATSVAASTVTGRWS